MMDSKIIWNPWPTVPRDGTPVIALLGSYPYLSDSGEAGMYSMATYAARWHEDGWFDLDWKSLCFRETNGRPMGWIAFPLIADPCPRPGMHSPEDADADDE